MRNILYFVRRYSHFLFFLFLQAISILIITRYNKFQNASATASLNNVTGYFNNKYATVNNYFKLDADNKKLAKEIERWKNNDSSNFIAPSNGFKTVGDTIKINDSTYQYRKWYFKEAAVVRNSVNLPNNFIVINRGENQGISKDMGIIDANDGVVGIVRETSKNYAVIMSLLHRDSKIGGKLLKGGETGTISWDGNTPNVLQMSKVPKSAKVDSGDVVITSGSSEYFKKGLIIGTVTKVTPEKTSKNFLIEIKSAVNFYNVTYVYALENRQKEEINSLLDKLKSSK